MAREIPESTRLSATYSVAEAAQRLGLTDSAIRKRLDRGVLQAVATPLGRVRIDKASVEDERRRLLDRVNVEDAAAETERLESEVAALRLLVDQLTAEKAMIKGAFDSLLAAEASLHDTIRQLVAEQRVVDP